MRAIALLFAALCGAATVFACHGSAEETSAASVAVVAADGGRDGGFWGQSHTSVRLMAANISSGNGQKYEGPGIRIFQALRPDVVMIQEFNYASSTDADIRAMVDEAFGADYSYYREPEGQIPNGVITRFPILRSGRWRDPMVSNRSFAYAKIAVPGAHPLWAVSVHFLTTGSNNRNAEARAVLRELGEVLEPDDYVTLGGDFNTSRRTEIAIDTLAGRFDTSSPPPSDDRGNGNTNAARAHPYDWVLVDHQLKLLQVPTVINGTSFPNGLVFDSRVYTPLADVEPVRAADSRAVNMQHMAVVRDFALGE